ncbi:MAG: MipA/OmpV family protein [Povalibacter sp.]
MSSALCANAAPLQSGCTSPSDDCVEVGQLNISISLGAGLRSNPVVGESDIPLVVLPHISYYGKRFFLENLDFGFTLFENRKHTLNLLASPGYDRVFFYRGDLQNIFINGSSGVVTTAAPALEFDGGIPVTYQVRRRHTTYLAGPEWLFNYDRFVGQVDALYEITGEHDGYEVRAAVATPIIQTQHSLVFSAGMTWKSAAVVRYYYGVDGFYEPGSSFSPFIKIGYSHPLSSRWTFNAFLHYEYLGSDVANSPIVGDEGVSTAFVGFAAKIL